LNCITTEGIKLSNEFDLATTYKITLVFNIEKKLTLCEHCGSIIAPEDQIKWITEKIGSAAFLNPTLFLTYLKDYSRVDSKRITKK
jgi:hypothetical protein